MSLNLRHLAPGFAVTGQLTPLDLPEVAALGFGTVINNRPDGEASEQPPSEEVERAARAAGLQYRFLPVNGAYQSPEEIAAFARLLEELPRPLLAFCRSGARSTRLFIAASGG